MKNTLEILAGIIIAIPIFHNMFFALSNPELTQTQILILNWHWWLIGIVSALLCFVVALQMKDKE